MHHHHLLPLLDPKDDTRFNYDGWSTYISFVYVRGRSEPDRPRIESIETGYDFVNVSWRPSAEEPSTNPASEFVVEYQLLHGRSAIAVHL